MVNSKKTNFMKSWGLLFIALAIAGAAFWLAISYLTAKEGSLREQILSEKVQKIQVVVASQDLFPGDIVDLNTMAIAFADNENLSGFAIQPQDFSSVEGAIIRYPMTAGEPLLSHFIVGDGIERFSDLLEHDERAVTLEIDSLNSAAGMMVAGDFVDVMLLMDDKTSGGNDKKNLRPLLQKVRILSVDAYPLRAKEQDFVINVSEGEIVQYSNVTIAAKFDDASKLVLARDLGDLVFMLRNKSDSKLHDAELITEFDLDEDTKSSMSYQYYAASSGEIKALTKTIVSRGDINRKKRVFSIPITSVEPLKVVSSDVDNNSQEKTK